MASACRETGPYGRKRDTPGRRGVGVDAAVASLADAQHGVVSLGQLRQLGVTETAVHKQAGRGRLHRIHRGVYAVGRRGLGIEGRFAAAVMACGPGALLSHRAAAQLLGLLDSATRAIDVTVASTSGRTRGGVIVIHRSTTLAREDVTRAAGIPCTAVARTLLDLADVLGERRLRSAVATAERLRLYDDRQVKAALARGGGRPAVARLRSVLAAYEEPDGTRSELERRALALFADGGLPRPLINGYVETAAGPLQVDFLWPDRGLVVEADSYRWHSSRRDFENDRKRDQLLRAAGFAVLRLTWRQVMGDRERILRALETVH